MKRMTFPCVNMSGLLWDHFLNLNVITFTKELLRVFCNTCFNDFCKERLQDFLQIIAISRGCVTPKKLMHVAHGGIAVFVKETQQ